MLAALAMAAADQPDLALVDIILQEDEGGIATAEELQKHYDLPIVFLTAFSTPEIMERAKKTAPAGYLLKPFRDKELITTIELALHKHQLLATIQKAKQDWEQTFDAMPDMVAIIDDQFRITRLNRTMADRLHVNPDEVIGRHCYQVIHGSDQPPADCPHTAMLANGRAHSMEMEEKTLAGHFQFIAAPIKDVDGRSNGSVHIIRDISERKQAEQQQKKSQAMLQAVIDGVTDAVTVIGIDYRILLANRISRAVHGDASLAVLPEFCYQHLHEQGSPCTGTEHPCPMQEVLRLKTPVTTIHHHPAKNGKLCPVELIASPLLDDEDNLVGIIEVGRDISERLRLEKERREMEIRLFQQQKDDSITTLAGGIAHDFNNTLTAVLGNAELAQMKTEPHGECGQHLQLIINAAQHMAHLTSQLLAYAKGGKYRTEFLHLNEIIAETMALAYKGKASGNKVISNLAADLGPVQADASQIRQMLVNIFNNAFESMIKEPGVLTVRSMNVVHDLAFETTMGRRCPAGEYVRITVSDTGTGVPDDLRQKIFEPFFSTKFIGRGLGLAAASGIANNHGGCILLDPAVAGMGATFQILLPRAKEVARPQPARRVKPGVLDILVVDDSREILDLLQTMLVAHKFTVTTCDNGPAALEFIRGGAPCDLVILDVQMPTMSGSEVYAKLKQLRPGIRILVNSGYDQESALADIDLEKDDRFLRKPFRFAEILLHISQMTARNTDHDKNDD